MSLILDHLAVAAETLEEAVAHVEQALGVAMSPGGRHARFATHNQLLGLADGLYLEAIAVDRDAVPPRDARWFDLDRFAGDARLSNWICRVDDLDAACVAFPDAGRSVDLRRDALRWRMAVPADGVLPFGGMHPALIQWQVSPLPGDSLPGSGCRLVRLDISLPQATALSAVLSGQWADDRVRIQQGAADMQAEFETPHGRRVLI